MSLSSFLLPGTNKGKAKAIDKGMVLSDIRLIEKTGGKSGDWKAEP